MSRFTQVGEEFTGTLELTSEEISRFAAESGDENPLHHDEAYASGTRFGGLIASGTHVVAKFMGLSATSFSRKGAALGLEFAFRLRKAARAGDTLQMRWTVLRVDENAKLGGELVHLKGEIRDGQGDVAVSATATLLVTPKL